MEVDARWLTVGLLSVALLSSGAADGGSSPMSGVRLVWMHGDRPAVLWGMRADGRGERPLWVTGADDPVRDFAWSPDGRRLAYYSPGPGAMLLVHNVESGRRTALPGSSVCGGGVSFSPDGRSIICQGEPDSEWVYVISHGKARRVADGEPDSFSIFNPAWGPSGLIAATAPTLGLSLWSVRPRLHPEGKTLRQPQSDYNGDPAWSPDARWIAFDSPGAGDGPVGIWTVRADGTDLRCLGRGSHPSFSPDGGWIAFESDRSGDQEIYVMQRDGTNVRRVTNRPGPDYEPLWRP